MCVNYRERVRDLDDDERDVEYDLFQTIFNSGNQIKINKKSNSMREVYLERDRESLERLRRRFLRFLLLFLSRDVCDDRRTLLLLLLIWLLPVCACDSLATIDAKRWVVGNGGE